MCSEKLDTLEVVLGHYKEHELFELAKSYKVRGYSLVTQSELIKKLSHAILAETGIIMTILEKEYLEFIEKIAKDKWIQLDESNKGIAETLIKLGWARLSSSSYKQCLYVAKEIITFYEEQKESPMFIERYQQMKQLRKYRNSLLNLYGIVEITWLKQLYQRDIKIDIDMREFIKVLEIINYFYKGCGIISYYIVHESLYCTEKEEFNHFKQVIDEVDYYEPTADQIREWENEFYYVETLATKRVKEYLKKQCFLEEDLAEFAVAVLSVHMRIQEDVKMVNMLQVIEEWYRLGIHIGGTKQLEGMIPLVLQMMEETRMWRLKGHMPGELGIKLASVVSKVGRVTQEKVQLGRNELCICGSGKKYKKCCLNKHE